MFGLSSIIGRGIPWWSLREAGLGEKCFLIDRMVCHLSLADPDESLRRRFARSTALSFLADFCYCFLKGLDLILSGENDWRWRILAQVAGERYDCLCWGGIGVRVCWAASEREEAMCLYWLLVKGELFKPVYRCAWVDINDRERRCVGKTSYLTL